MRAVQTAGFLAHLSDFTPLPEPAACSLPQLDRHKPLGTLARLLPPTSHYAGGFAYTVLEHAVVCLSAWFPLKCLGVRVLSSSARYGWLGQVIPSIVFDVCHVVLFLGSGLLDPVTTAVDAERAAVEGDSARRLGLIDTTISAALGRAIMDAQSLRFVDKRGV